MSHKTIAIQGYKGSYHEQVAQEIFTESNTQPFDDFRSLYTAVEQQNAELGIAAIENSIAGPILENYDLQRHTNTQVIGEYYLPIHHCLVALPNQTINEIKEVWSHPMALKQSQEFLRQYAHLKQVEASDTALSAKQIANENLKNVAAIASERTAHLFGLEVIATNIETDQQNYTRFWIFQNPQSSIGSPLQNNGYYKTSLYLETKHKSGSLLEVLKSFQKHELNLTMLVSRPIIGKPWEYGFYLDFIHNSSEIGDFLKELHAITTKMQLLGTYPQHSSPLNATLV